MKKMLAGLALVSLPLWYTPSFAATQSLNNTTWQISSLSGWRGTPPATIQPRVTLTFSNGVLSGNNSCNNFRANYSHPRVPNAPQSLSIRMDQGMSTMMACPPEQTRLSGALSTALSRTYQYSYNDKYLTLMDNRGAALASFERPATDVPGTSWQLIAYNDGRALLSSRNTERMTASFNRDGSISGFAGCNSYRASYTLDQARGTMRIGPVASTNMLCPNQELMKEEAGFLNAWRRVGLYGRQGDGLSLFDAQGLRMMDFRFTGPAAQAAPAPAPRPRPVPQPR